MNREQRRRELKARRQMARRAGAGNAEARALLVVARCQVAAAEVGRERCPGPVIIHADGVVETCCGCVDVFDPLPSLWHSDEDVIPCGAADHVQHACSRCGRPVN